MIRFVQILLLGIFASVSFDALAYKVHYYQQIETNGVTEIISDAVVETGSACRTVEAPRVDGYLFTGWTISTHQAFSSRHSWGHSRIWCEFVIYEQTTLTAHYLPIGQDEDADGFADGYEVFWFGNLEKDPDGDEDGDGLRNKAEVDAGSNPLFMDAHMPTGVASGLGPEVTYTRPNGYVDPDPPNPPATDDPDQPDEPDDPDDPNPPVIDPEQPKTFKCIVRSEPEGVLFASTTNRYPFGYQVTTSSYHPSTSAFGCWAINGEEQRSEYGWALGKVSFLMPSNTIEVVAFCEDDRDARNRIYWYGRSAVDGGDDDRDGDGRTLSEETSSGTNPLLPDASLAGGAASALGSVVWYNPSNYPSCTIRSIPEGRYVTGSFAYVRPGTVLELNSASGTECWYWRENGERFGVIYGNTLAMIRYPMPNYDVVLEAYVDEEADYDGDGYTHAQEVQAGTNPQAIDRSLTGGVASNLGSPVFYNPYNMQSYVVRSEPEGELFSSITNYVRPGTVVTTTSYDYRTTRFAYWTVNGVRAVDEFNVSTASAQFVMPAEAVEVVAILEEDEGYRERMHYYGLRVGSDYDYDGDGVPHDAELQGGTSPMFRDHGLAGGVASSLGLVTWYNPSNYPSCTIKSEPEGRFVGTSFEYVRPGTIMALNNRNGEDYWYWKENGGKLPSTFGTTLSSLRYVMPTYDVVLLAYYDGGYDEDGDGFSHDEEIAAGTNPYGFDRHFGGGVAWAVGSVVEVDLQPHEQVRGALVRGEYSELFTSPTFGNAAKSRTFGTGLMPVVCDVNGDGLFDFVLISEGATNVFINVGGVGNPEFEERNETDLSNVDLAATSISRLQGMNLDVEPYEGLSCTFGDVDMDGSRDLLVSDGFGHIWYYRNTSNNSTPVASAAFALQHKVWGGTYDGFANGLRISAVDWDDDGDLDCLCGTAEGKLMLLRDPRIGRPTNLRGAIGADNVLLTWDPNAQPRVRGYKVYRSIADVNSYRNMASPYIPLPTYRDFPDITETYDYKVSAVSRFYIAGNSTPTVNESPATEPLRVEFGQVRFFWKDASAKLGEKVTVMLSLENSAGFSINEPLAQVVAYDPEYLTPVKVSPTGLTETNALELVESASDGEWSITLRLAAGHAGRVTLPPGGGKFLELVFDTNKEGSTTVGGDSGATVVIENIDDPDPKRVPPYSLGDLDGNGYLDERDARVFVKVNPDISPYGRKATANQIKAGDFNGDDGISGGDTQLFVDFMNSKGIKVKLSDFVK